MGGCVAGSVTRFWRKGDSKGQNMKMSRYLESVETEGCWASVEAPDIFRGLLIYGDGGEHKAETYFWRLVHKRGHRSEELGFGCRQLLVLCGSCSLSRHVANVDAATVQLFTITNRPTVFDEPCLWGKSLLF